MHWEATFRKHAGYQEGLLASFQARALGATKDQWYQARHNGRWEPWGPRLIIEAGLPRNDHRRALAAVLESSPGAWLHAETSLAWLDLPAYDLRHLLVARKRGRSGRPAELAELHELRSVRAHDIIVVRGVATETALRAIWVIAARYASPQRVDLGYLRIGRLLDAAHRAGLVTWAGLHEMVDGIAQRGRAGTVLMRALAEERPPGSSVTESRQEQRLEELLRDAGERPLDRQVAVGGHEPIGRCDHRDPRLPLVVETNSETYHTTPTDQAADELRYHRLTLAGYTVGVVWQRDLWRNPRAAVDTVRIARAHAEAGRAVVVHSPGCPWTTSYLSSGYAA